MIIDKKVGHFYNQLYIIASLDIQYQKIGHIRLLKLYKLGKECLKIRLQDKKMS